MTQYTRRDNDPDTPDKHDHESNMTDEEIDGATERISQRMRNLHRGGYFLSGDGKRSPRVTVTLPRDVRDKVEAQAAAEGMSVSKYLRRIITEYAA